MARVFGVGGLTVVLALALLGVLSSSAFAAAPEAPGPITLKYVGAEAVYLGGVLDPGSAGAAGTYEFLYRVSPTECKGGSHAPASPGVVLGAKEEEVSESIGSLLPDTTYTVCLLDQTTGGETAGPALTFKTALPPETPETLKADLVGATTATLHGVVNPKKEGEAGSYEFVYRKSGTTPEQCQGEGETTTTPADSNGNAGEVVAPERVTGLTPTTEYTFCLIAHNSAEAGEIAVGPAETFTTLAGAPTILEEFATEVGSASATLNATIEPGGATTTYRFEYGTGSEYAPVAGGEGSVGSGTSAVAVNVHIQTGLLLNTSYHYRVVATNTLGTVPGEGEAFTTQAPGGALSLIDGRQWEMVSPSNKHGSGIEPLTLEGGEIQAARDGSAITYVATGPVTKEPVGDRSPEPSQVFSSRAAPGTWATQDIGSRNDEATEFAAGQGSEYRLFSSDLSTGLLEPRTAAPLSSEATGKTLYLRNDSTGIYQALVTAGSVPSGRKFGQSSSEQLTFAGASPDLSHVVFSSSEALTEEVTTNTGIYKNLYEWADGGLQLVSVLPDGRPASEPGVGGTPTLAQLGYYSRITHDAISTDGTRIVWEGHNITGEGSHLYLRDTATGETVQLDVAEPTLPPTEAYDLVYQGANSSGSRVFFTDGRPLTATSRANEQTPDLYVAEITTGLHGLEVSVTDLTAETVDGQPGFVVSRGDVLGYGQEGADVYFVANGRLTDGSSAGNCVGNESATETCNLYVDHYTDGKWTPRVVARVSGADYNNWGQDSYDDSHTARVSSNGTFMAFMSERPLTGYDNRDAVSGERDEEVYLYDAASEHLVCASCDPTGARPHGVYDTGGYPGMLVDHQGLWDRHWIASILPGATEIADGESNYESRALSSNGRVFFDSTDALVPQDSNGLEDVYEYEPEGVGGCEAASGSGGCVGMISSGTSDEESAFLDAGESGDDVFFLTAARLSKQDYDKAFDVYDAHACSAQAPCANEATTTSPPCTTADSCRAAGSPQPGILGAPPSATFSGAGNPPVTTSVRAKSLTRAQKLASALKTCRKKPKKKRAGCEATARKRYGVRAAARGKKTKKSERRGA